MRLLFAGLLLGLLPGLFGPLATAQTLWRGVSAGAPPDAVIRAIPEARPPAQATAERGQQVLLEIPAVDIAGAAFSVRFLFDNERLQRIAMRSDAGSPEAARSLAQRVYTSLRQRYGLEISTRSRGNAADASASYDRRWLFRRTTVRLQVVDQRFVTLDYGVETPRTGSGL